MNCGANWFPIYFLVNVSYVAGNIDINDDVGIAALLQVDSYNVGITTVFLCQYVHRGKFQVENRMLCYRDVREIRFLTCVNVPFIYH